MLAPWNEKSRAWLVAPRTGFGKAPRLLEKCEMAVKVVFRVFFGIGASASVRRQEYHFCFPTKSMKHVFALWWMTISKVYALSATPRTSLVTHGVSMVASSGLGRATEQILTATTPRSMYITGFTVLPFYYCMFQKPELIWKKHVILST
jgi:hypothetical protein